MNGTHRFDVTDAVPAKYMTASSAIDNHCAQRLVSVLRTAVTMYTLPDIHNLMIIFSRSPCYHQHAPHAPQCEVGCAGPTNHRVSMQRVGGE
jgi:hypothetical protein